MSYRKKIKRYIIELLYPIFQDIIERILDKDSINIKRQQCRNARSETIHYINSNLTNASMYSNRFELLTYALSQVKNNNDLFCEFGVASGDTINHIAKQIPKCNVFGFDIFEGLPEDWRDGYPKGTFSVEELPKTLSNVQLIVGLFNDTLPNFLLENLGNIAFLHVDCDLYSSTVTIFKELEKRICSGTIIVFDEYMNYQGWKLGEYKAFQEYIERLGINYEYIGYNTCQVAVRIL